MLVLCIKHAAAYKPNVELDLKFGNNRNIVRIGTLFPVWNNNSQLLFTSLFIMGNTSKSIEGNFGLGIRRYANQQIILGGYGFYDIRRLVNSSKKAHQITIGVELLSAKFEMRINGYLPISESTVTIKNISTSINRNFNAAQGKTTQSILTNRIVDFILRGYDIEAGYKLPISVEANVFAGFYHFFRENISFLGPRGRIECKLLPWLAAQLEASYDKERNFNGYVGLKLQYKFSKNYKNKTGLSNKMTQLPVRDIDIMTSRKPALFKQEEEFPGLVPLVIVSNPDRISLKGNAILAPGDSASTVQIMNLIATNGLENYQFMTDSKVSTLLSTPEDIINEDLLLAFQQLLDNNGLNAANFFPDTSNINILTAKERKKGNLPRIQPGGSIFNVLANVQLNINQLIVIPIPEETQVGGVRGGYQRAITPLTRDFHAVFNLVLQGDAGRAEGYLPKNIPLAFPYNYEIDDTRIIRAGIFDRGKPKFLTAIEIEDLVLPEAIKNKLAEFGIRDNQVKGFLSIQSSPWGDGSQIQLKPHTYLSPNASAGAGEQYSARINAFKYTQADGVTSLGDARGSAGVSVHHNKFSPSNMQVILNTPAESQKFYSVVIDRESPRQRAAVTMHMLLTEGDTAAYQNQVVANIIDNNTAINQLPGLFNASNNQFLTAQFNDVNRFINGY